MLIQRYIQNKMNKVKVPNICIILTVFLVLCNKTTSETSICPYPDTVDLTNHTPLADGSYVYHNIVIPKDKTAEYDYRLTFLNREQSADPHVRGCVCGANSKNCVKLCCERGQYFSEVTAQCEEIPSDLNMATQMQITFDSGTETEVNIFDYFVYQVGLPCQHPEALTSEYDGWNLLKNGSLFVHYDSTALDTVSYCLTPYRYNGTDENVLVAMSCPMKEEVSWQMLLNTYAMAISVVFLVPTVLVYLVLKELRGNMRGKLLICYLVSLIVAYSIISLINISNIIFSYTICSLLGFTCYYFFMAAFIWLSVLCLDIWHNFKEHSIEMSAKKNRIRFIWYSLYAWVSAGLLTWVTVWAEWSDHVPELYKPGIGTYSCWLDTNKWSAAIYFYWPNLIILVMNLITFGHLTLRIYSVRRDLAKMTQKEKFFQENRWKEFEQLSMDPILPSLSSLSSFSSSALVILRLFLIMGISWIADILSYCLRNYTQFEFLFVATDFCNAIQGVLIFVLFVFKRNVMSAVNRRFSPTTTRKPRRSVTSLSTQFSKLSTSSHVPSP